MKEAFKYVKRMLPLFCAVVKFCSTNRLFTRLLLVCVPLPNVRAKIKKVHIIIAQLTIDNSVI